ncbi:hypothetical protein JCM33374_g2855 [Metschnikowia sp. JCM 33374]|nr:hypothetical protein JCM33374_g2855 [Metschnikowia sp. JCM 33374]
MFGTQKPVYGMKQAGFEWYMILATKLERLRLRHSEVEETIFTKSSKFGKLTVALYVDDLLLVADHEKVLEEFKKDLGKMFDVKYFAPVSEYLAIEFTGTPVGYAMKQLKHLTELVDDFKQYRSRPRRTPIKVDYDGYGSSHNPKTDEFHENPEDTP